MNENKRLNKKEFFELIKLQKKHLQEIIKLEEPQFKLGLKGMSDNDKKFLELCVNKISNNIEEEILIHIKNKSWELGLIHIRLLYWKIYHISLLPLLYKHYKNMSPSLIRSKFEGRLISEFLLKDYPYLHNSIKNIHLNYYNLRKEYQQYGLSSKLGYGDDLPEHLPKGFSLGTIIDLVKEIRNFNPHKEMMILKTIQLRKEGRTQQEISEITGISQSTISRILKPKNLNT